jgi:hypothetical protein
MTTITIETAKLKAALICASNDQIRYYINGVYVDPRGYIVSTDGHRLFCARIDLSGVPAFDGWIMPRDAIKRALTGYKLDTIDIAPDRIGDIACRSVDGTFPQWERVLPSHDLSGEIAQFNSAYVADLGEIGRILTGKRKADAGLTAHIHHNGQAPAGVTFPDCKDAFAVLMPIRSNHIDPTSAWTDLRKAAPTI